MNSEDWLYVFLFYAALQLAWTIIVRWLPDLLGKSIISRIELKNNEQLETLKASLNESSQKDIEGLKAQYSALHSSVSYLSSAHSEMRAKTMAATETLWENFLLVQNTYASITFVESILTVNELKELFKSTATNSMKQTIAHYKDEKQFAEQIQKCFLPNRNNSRLHVSDRLWLIYYCATAFYARLALLTQMSLKKNEYQNWREDKPTIQLLSNILPKNIVDDLVDCHPDNYNPTMHQAMAYIDTTFLKEARKVISGSQALAESLTDINATMQLELANIETRKSK